MEIGSGSLKFQLARENSHVFIAATGEVNNQYVTRAHAGSNAQGLGYSVRAFERRQNSLRARQLDDGIERRLIVLRYIFRASGIVQHGVLWTNGCVVEPCGYGMCRRDLSVLILEHVGVSSLKDTWYAAAKARRMLAEFCAAASAVHAGNDRGGQPAFLLENLLFHLPADAALKIAHHDRIGMGAQCAA